MKRILLFCAFFACFSLAHARPPENGYVGTLVNTNGVENLRISCREFDLIVLIYEASVQNVFFARPTMDRFVAELSPTGDPICVSQTYGVVEVVGQELLGPYENLVGDAELFMWALHIDDDSTRRWVLFLDTMDVKPHFQVGSGDLELYEPKNYPQTHAGSK